MNKWIYTGLTTAGLIIGLALGFILCNILVTQPVKVSYQWQVKELIKTNAILAQIPKTMIQNTLTVKKVKRGSTIYYEPTSGIQAIEWKNGLDSLVNINIKDTISVTEKTFWEKLKFW